MKAVIIGAGIGGLAAGLALRQAGHQVQVFERAPAITEVGAGIGIWKNGMAVLESLGLGDLIATAAHPIPGSAIRRWDGTVLVQPPLAASPDTRPLVFAMHRAELVGALQAALGAEAITLGAAYTGFEEAGDGVTARFADGRAATGDILIGADGINSVVRAQIHGNTPPRYSGYTCWRFVTSFPHQARGVTMSESWGRGRRFGIVPISGDRVYWFATLNAPAGGRQSPPEEHAQLLQLFAGWHPPIREILEATPPDTILRNDIADRPPLSDWGQGRVTLLGDAAHAMTPNMGQGGCQALEDAVVLAGCLTNAATPDIALRTYEAARRDRTARFVTQSWQIGRVAQWENPIAVWARDVLFRAIPGSWQLRHIESLLAFAPGS